MRKIDTTNWTEFRVGELFDVYHGQRLNKSARIEGNIPFATAGFENQGIADYIGNSVETYKDAITVDMFGNSFYHAGEIAGDDNIYFFVNEELSDKVKSFIVACINAKTQSLFSYSKQFRQTDADNLTIQMPSKHAHLPDWETLTTLISNGGGVLDMKNIDTSSWREFMLSDLFEIETTKSLDKLMLDFDESYPYEFVGRSYANNGIQGKIKKQDFEPNSAKTFSLVQIGEQVCLYRKNEWYASQNIFILHPKYEKVEETSQFMSCLITSTLKQVYGDNAYASYPTKQSLNELTIKLPAISSIEPDYETMEQYMSEILEKSNEHAEHLAQLWECKEYGKGKKIDVEGWGEFRVGDLFDCSTTNAIPSKTDLIDGEINYVTRSAENNGLSAYCGNNDKLNKGNCITIGAEGFIAFWQNDDFVAGNKVYTLRHKCLNHITGLFVCTSLNVLSNNYSFSNARILDNIIKETIKLPQTQEGNPDWEYMEQYMKKIIDKELRFSEYLANLEDNK